MFDVKKSGVVAAGAFVLSLLLGLASGASVGIVFLRAGIFALVFFALVSGAYMLISRFMPELFDGSGGYAPGTRVNITLDDGPGLDGPDRGNATESGGALESSGGDALGDFSGFMGLDQNAEEGYTVQGLEEKSPFGEELVPPPGTAESPEVVSEGEPMGADEGLPDLSGLAEAFSGLEQDMAGKAPMETGPVRQVSTGVRPQKKAEGDFDPKGLAEAIRTTLKRDKG